MNSPKSVVVFKNAIKILSTDSFAQEILRTWKDTYKIELRKHELPLSTNNYPGRTLEEIRLRTGTNISLARSAVTNLLENRVLYESHDCYYPNIDCYYPDKNSSYNDEEERDLLRKFHHLLYATIQNEHHSWVHWSEDKQCYIGYHTLCLSMEFILDEYEDFKKAKEKIEQIVKNMNDGQATS